MGRLVLSCLAAMVAATSAQSARPAPPYSALMADGRHPVAAVTLGEFDLLRLDDLATLFRVSVREDPAANALTVSSSGKTVVLSLDQGLASISGRLVSLPAPPARDGTRWLVHPDFVSRALALILDTRIDVRKASRLIVVGDLRVPRITARPEFVGTATRLTLDVSPRAPYTVVQEPRRLLIKFDADGLDASTSGSALGLVEAVAVADPATIVLTLAADHGPFRATTVPIDAASSRVVIDVMPAGVSTPPPSPTQVPPAPTPGAPSEPVPPFTPAAVPSLRTIVVDPGHGGDEQGARGPAGTLEKDLTLDIARRLKRLIEGRLGIRVLLTRDEDRLVPLDERAAIANNNKADLFISLHANASPRQDTSGAEVFYLSLEGFSDEARRVAENPAGKTLPTAGGGSRDVQLILWEMAQARHLAESAVLAGFIEEELRRHVEMSVRPLQQAPFRVLVGANMPAVLVEMAFLSNPGQETLLNTEAFKNDVVRALLDAMLRYRSRLEGARRPCKRKGTLIAYVPSSTNPGNTCPSKRRKVI
jgi:N-acetylmuramoyl-L-alanine amidase